MRHVVDAADPRDDSIWRGGLYGLAIELPSAYRRSGNGAGATLGAARPAGGEVRATKGDAGAAWGRAAAPLEDAGGARDAGAVPPDDAGAAHQDVAPAQGDAGGRAEADASDSESVLDRAVAVAWRAAGMAGCLGLTKRWPRTYAEVACTADSLRRHGQLVGTVTLPRRQPAVCVLTIVEKPGASWLTLSIPMAALELVEPRSAAFPFRGSDSLLWRRPLDKWFAGLGRHIHDVLSFELALIGHDVAGMTTAAGLRAGPPTERWVGYLAMTAGALVYHPANR
jgi:hypothetical protein